MTRDQAIEIAKQLFGRDAPQFVDILFKLTKQEFDEPTSAAEEKFRDLCRGWPVIGWTPSGYLNDLKDAGLSIVEKKP